MAGSMTRGFVKAIRSAGGLVARVPSVAFRPMFAGFVRLGHDRADVATESVSRHWRPYADHGGAAAFVRQTGRFVLPTRFR